MIRIMTPMLVAGLLCLRAAAAAVVDDFERTEPGMPSSAAVTIALVDAEAPAAGKALSIAWPLPHKAFVEANYAKPVPLPLKADEMAAIRFDAWIPAAPSISAISVRLLDAHYQTFQWMIKVSRAPTAGWRTIVIPLDPGTAGHWGGSNDGQLAYPAKLFGFTLVYANSTVPAGHVLIDNVRVDPLPTVVLATDRFPSLVNTGPSGKCDLVVSNPFDHPIDLTIKGNLTTFSGAASEVAGSLTVPAGGKSYLAVLIPDRQPGIRWLDATIRFEELEFNSKTSFVIADPVERAGGTNDFLFGLVSHVENQPAAAQPAYFEAAAAAGATVMRINAAWSGLERKPGEWHWDALDQTLALAARYGIEPQLTLGWNPTHAVAPALRDAQAEAYKRHDPDAWQIAACGPPEEGPWRHYVAETVGRYRGKVRLYEVLNEPDLGWRGTTDEYIRLLRAADEELHGTDPNAQLLTGGFATLLEHHGRARNPDLQARVLAEASDAFDIHAMHQHGLFPQFQGIVDGELRRLRARMTHPRPLYFNETAESSAYIGEKAQAVTLVKKLAFAWARGAIGYTWYDLRNDGADAGNMEHNYGMLTANFHPKAVFAAYGEAVRRLHGARHLGDLDLGPEPHAYVFGGPLGRTLVWWNENPDAPSIPVLLRCGEGPVRNTDIMGVAQDVARCEDVVMVQPAAEPHYVELPPGTDVPPVAGALVDLQLPPAASVGHPLHVTAALMNPLGAAHAFRLAWCDAAGVATNASVSVPAHTRAQFPLSFPAPTARQSTLPLDVAFSVADTPWSGTIHGALHVQREIDDTPPDGRPADWVLESRANVVDLCQADPALNNLTWKGPDDLSARIWVWQQEPALRIRVDVRDNIHVQNEKPVEMWRGDSVQVAIRIPVTGEEWEIGAAMRSDGQVIRYAWLTPPGVTNAETCFDAACQTIPGGVRYELTLPVDRFGLTPQALQQGFRFNLLVNDNDGNLRKGYIRIAPGFGDAKNPDAFPLLRRAGPASGPKPDNGS